MLSGNPNWIPFPMQYYVSMAPKDLLQVLTISISKKGTTTVRAAAKNSTQVIASLTVVVAGPVLTSLFLELSNIKKTVAMGCYVPKFFVPNADPIKGMCLMMAPLKQECATVSIP